MAYWLAKKGLRPLLCILITDGTLTLLIKILKVFEKLNFDLYTHVINWDEFKEMQLAYLKASVVDIEKF